jgi:arylsulfatase A-like enzyme
VDEAIGRLLAGARGHGETMVVLTADHGEGFLEHGSITHGNGLYSELLSVPLIVKPFHPATGGVKEAALVSTQQIAATILDACGLPDTPALPMASALPLSGAAVGGPVVTLGSYGEYAIGVTFGHYRYVYAPPSEREELYDLDADPGERFSLIRSVPEVRAEGLRLVRSAVADAESWRARLGIKAVRPAAMDEDTLRRLKALGYVQ